MEIALIVGAFILVLVGIAGCLLPVLPGPPLAWAGLLLLSFTKSATFSTSFLISTAIVTLILTVLDYCLPGYVVRKKGGSKAGERGALAGAIIGVFMGPLGIILGPFVGAWAGEMWAKNGDVQQSLRIAFSSFIGFLYSTGLKLAWCLLLAFWMAKEMLR